MTTTASKEEWLTLPWIETNLTEESKIQINYELWNQAQEIVDDAWKQTEGVLSEEWEFNIGHLIRENKSLGIPEDIFLQSLLEHCSNETTLQVIDYLVQNDSLKNFCSLIIKRYKVWELSEDTFNYLLDKASLGDLEEHYSLYLEHRPEKTCELIDYLAENGYLKDFCSLIIERYKAWKVAEDTFNYLLDKASPRDLKGHYSLYLKHRPEKIHEVIEYLTENDSIDLKFLIMISEEDVDKDVYEYLLGKVSPNKLAAMTKQDGHYGFSSNIWKIPSNWILKIFDFIKNSWRISEYSEAIKRIMVRTYQNLERNEAQAVIKQIIPYIVYHDSLIFENIIIIFEKDSETLCMILNKIWELFSSELEYEEWVKKIITKIREVNDEEYKGVKANIRLIYKFLGYSLLSGYNTRKFLKGLEE